MPADLQQSALTRMQEALVKGIQANPFFAGIEVMYERLENIEYQILSNLKQRTGICILVLTPFAKVSKPAAPGRMFSARMVNP